MAQSGLGAAIVDGITAFFARLRSIWRGSISLRVVSTTLVLSLVVVGLVGALLITRLTSGLLDAKERTSVAEATAGLSEAQRLLDAADTGPTTPSASRLVDGVTTALAQRAGNPGIYEILLLATPPKNGDAPERGTNLVSEVSVPPDLRGAVQLDGRQSWTYSEIRYLDGRAIPGLVVGAPLSVPTVGAYELYYLYPLAAEQETLDLIRRTVLGVGTLLVLVLGGIAYVVTRQVVNPVRQAARTAAALSAGNLTERMVVHGEDDLAQLAMSFNDMAASLQEQIRRLESLSRVQQRFVSDVSHELRTPLTTVRMAADVLYEERADFDPVMSRSAELLQTQLDRFESLLSDLLEVSRFDAGAAILDAEHVDMRALVERIIESSAPLVDARGSALSVVAPDEAVLVEVDPRRIDRVLRNLVVNAVEHGDGNPIVITIVANEDAVAVGVRDHGVGLKPGESSLVFNRFWRADLARARSTGGTGLGLAIALEDARLHGGWLEAWGAPGAGANFRLTLPRRVYDQLSESPLPLEPADAAASGTRRVTPYVKGRGGLGDPTSTTQVDDAQVRT